MLNRILEILKSDFLQNLGKMVSGTGFAHLLGVAIIPVLTRLYTPEEIGTFATYISIFMICFCVASLRYENAILIPKNEFLANNITVLASVITLFFSLFFLFVLLLFGEPISKMLNIQALGALMYLIPISVLSYSLFMILTFSLNREKKYGTLATGKITASSITATGQIGLGLLHLKEAGLVIGKVVGELIGMVFLLWQRWKLTSSVLAGVSVKRMTAMAKRYQNFPLYNTPHALTTTTSNNFPVLLFNSFFSEAIAGFYSMAAKACYSPVQVISQAAYQVFGQRISEKYANKDEIVPFVNKTVLLLGGLGFVPFLILFIVSPVFFAWFLGPGWEMAGYFVRILTPFIFLSFIVQPLNFIPLMVGRQRKAFVIDFIYMVLRLVALSIGIYLQSVWISVVLFSAVGVLVLSYQIYWFYSLAQKEDRLIKK